MKYPDYMKPLFLAILLPALAACNDASVPLPSSGVDSDVLRINSVNMEGVKTRSIVENASTNGFQIGVYALNEDDTEYIPAKGGSNTGVYQYDGTKSVWNAVASDGSKLLRLPSTGNCKVYAYYPSTLTPVYQSAGGTYLTGVTVLSQDDFTATAQTDYLYPQASVTANATTRDVSFILKHALAKLTFKVYKLPVISETVKLSRLQIITNSNSLQTGSGKSMVPATGRLQGLVGTNNITLAASTGQEPEVMEKSADNSPTASPFCLVAPAPNVEYLSFQLTVLTGGNEQTYLTQQFKMTTNWVAGGHFVFTLVLNGMNAVISGMKLYDWEGYTETNIPI